jgi:hypothetical protein
MGPDLGRRGGRELVREPKEEGFVWMAQAAMESWAGRADVKASVLLAWQGAAFVLLATGNDRLGGACSRLPALAAMVAGCLLVAATCLAALVIVPALGSVRRHRAQMAQHTFFFGHVRLWQPQALAERLARLTADEQRTMMAHHLVAVSAINWRKYRLLQASVMLTLMVVGALVFAFVARSADAACAV